MRFAFVGRWVCVTKLNFFQERRKRVFWGRGAMLGKTVGPDVVQGNSD